MDFATQTFRAGDAAYAAGISLPVLRKLADAGLPVAGGGARGEHRVWSASDIVLAAVGGELMAAGADAWFAATILRPSFGVRFSEQEPETIDVYLAGRVFVGQLQIGAVVRAVLARIEQLSSNGRHGVPAHKGACHVDP